MAILSINIYHAGDHSSSRKIIEILRPVFLSIIATYFVLHRNELKEKLYTVQYRVLMTYDCSRGWHFSPWQTWSTEHHLNFSGKHSATLQLLPIHQWLLSTARYSFIQLIELSELEQRKMNKFAHNSTQQHGIWTWVQAIKWPEP